ncbi:MAG: hypothetical protein H7Z14_12915, partial [Anaerolineae bacterium]|nr:hypothetical protein [Phycisphaerae bacterium]
MRGRTFVSLAIVALAGFALFDRSARADVVFQATNNNGFFTPFSSSTPAGVKYGDSGWIGSGGGPYALTSITLGLIVDGGTVDGSTDIKFTFNDGD